MHIYGWCLDGFNIAIGPSFVGFCEGPIKVTPKTYHGVANEKSLQKKLGWLRYPGKGKGQGLEASMRSSGDKCIKY